MRWSRFSAPNAWLLLQVAEILALMKKFKPDETRNASAELARQLRDSSAVSTVPPPAAASSKKKNNNDDDNNNNNNNYNNEVPLLSLHNDATREEMINEMVTVFNDNIDGNNQAKVTDDIKKTLRKHVRAAFDQSLERWKACVRLNHDGALNDDDKSKQARLEALAMRRLLHQLRRKLPDNVTVEKLKEISFDFFGSFPKEEWCSVSVQRLLECVLTFCAAYDVTMEAGSGMSRIVYVRLILRMPLTVVSCVVV